MVRIINFLHLIRYISIFTTLLTIAIYELVAAVLKFQLDPTRVLTIAPVVAVTLIFLLTAKWSSRTIWAIARWFDSSLYPDLNGVWEGEIRTRDGKTLTAKAVIRQTLLSTEIDMHTETAKSVTLETTPSIEGGNSRLYYTYRATPSNPGHGSYIGSTIFDVRKIVAGKWSTLELSGFYYTERETSGRTRLRQTSGAVNQDVSFY